jgi:hypothetical protein
MAFYSPGPLPCFTYQTIRQFERRKESAKERYLPAEVQKNRTCPEGSKLSVRLTGRTLPVNLYPQKSHQSQKLFNLPLVMTKGFISLSHAMGIFFLLKGRTGIIEGIQQFRGQFLRH